jgi:glycosyltransferase involved in cell wall biosynthesis
MKEPLVELIFNGRFLAQEITGVQRYAHELLYALDRLAPTRPDIKITVVSPRLHRTPPALKNIPIVQSDRLDGHAWEQIALPFLARGKILFCPGNTAPALSLLTGQQVVVCVHDLSYLYFPTAYSQAFRLVYGMLIPLIFRSARGVITVSESERKSIIDHYPFVKSRLTAIQNGGLMDERVPASSGPRGQHGYVLYVGSLSKRKNFPNMFEVACRLARQKGYRFVFVGGTAGGLVASQYAVPNDLTSLIMFAGQINSTSELIKYYEGAHVLMFPSFYEASPLPPIEAMACGCPVIASTIPSLQERCGDAAIYCDPDDVDDIGRCIQRVMDDPSLHEELSRKGKERAALFSWKNCAIRTLDVIASI